MKKLLSLVVSLFMVGHVVSAQSYKNIAADKHVGASTSIGKDTAGYLVTDGNDASMWMANPGPQWIIVDLGQETDVDGIRIKWDSVLFGAEYDVVCGNVDNAITTVVATETAGNGNDDEHLFNVKARYIGLDLKKSNYNGYTPYAIKEIEILVKDSAPVVATTSSIAMSRERSLIEGERYDESGKRDGGFGNLFTHVTQGPIYERDDEKARFFVSFPLTSIPAGSTITGVKLRLKTYDQESKPAHFPSVYKLEGSIDDSWVGGHGGFGLFENGGWLNKYADMSFVKDEPYSFIVSNSFTQEGLDELIAAYQNGTEFAVALKMQFNNSSNVFDGMCFLHIPDVYLDVEYH